MAEITPRMLAGRYQVGDLIGRGGMAEVHIGRDTRLGRTVAIKVLRSDLARDPSFQARFRREAQAAAGLNHPSIVAVYDTGEDVSTDPATGQQLHLPFIVMEYVEGHTVRELVKDGAALPIDEAVEITQGVLSALQYAHQAGIVHRDVKPANVMITTTGQIKVMDFGIARALADSAATMTQTQAVIGTAQYLSPEQARGEQVDTRSDLYSAGCLLYELLTGRTPFVGDSAVAVAYQHVREEAAPPSTYAPDVPEVLDRITMKALTKDREQRYQTAAEFRADLQAAMSGGQVLAPAVGAMTAETQLMQPTAATQVMGATPAPVPAAFAGGATQAGATSLLPPDGAGEDDDDEGKKRGWLIGLGIALAVIAAGLIIFFIVKGSGASPQPTTTVTTPAAATVPVVTQGMTLEDAKAKLTEMGFTSISQASEPSATVAKDGVIRFEPESGASVPLTTPIKIVVSAGPNQFGVPDYKGWTLDSAKADLEKKGLEVGALNAEPSQEYDKDTVIRTDPAAGTPVKKGDSVAIYYASGQVEVPSVVGMTESKAQSTLEKAGLQLGEVTEQETSDQKPGTVLSQLPSSGMAQKNSKVNLTVAKAVANVEVPDIAGLSGDAADSLLSQLGLVPQGQTQVISDINQCANQSVSDGRVCKSTPASGASVKPGATVKYWLYQAPVEPTTDPTTNTANAGGEPTP